MNEIKITLTVPGLPEAINNLADAIRGNSTAAAPVASAPVVQQPTAQATQPEAAPVVNPTPAVATPATNGVPTANTQPVNPANVPPATVAQSSPVSHSSPSEAAVVNYTIEQLSVAGAALCEQGKMPQLIALLGKYGVQAVTQLNPAPETLNAFAAEMKALGANL